jgi:hypothetical protein
LAWLWRFREEKGDAALYSNFYGKILRVPSACIFSRDRQETQILLVIVCDCFLMNLCAFAHYYSLDISHSFPIAALQLLLVTAAFTLLRDYSDSDKQASTHE